MPMSSISAVNLRKRYFYAQTGISSGSSAEHLSATEGLAKQAVSVMRRESFCRPADIRTGIHYHATGTRVPEFLRGSLLVLDEPCYFCFVPIRKSEYNHLVTDGV